MRNLRLFTIDYITYGGIHLSNINISVNIKKASDQEIAKSSLTVLFGAVGVWLGYPLADPVVGLIITAAIFGIVWESRKAVFTRLLASAQCQISIECCNPCRPCQCIWGGASPH